MSLLDNLPHTCSAFRRIRTKDTLGGNKDSYEAVSGFVDRACWRQQASDSEKKDFEKRGIRITNKVYFTSDPELTEKHILRFDASGYNYDVKSSPVPDASAGLGVVWKVMVERNP